MHVKNTEKPTFLVLKDDSIWRPALSESPITSLNFEHLLNQRTKTTLWLVRDTFPNATIWFGEMHTLNDLIDASNIPLSLR